MRRSQHESPTCEVISLVTIDECAIPYTSRQVFDDGGTRAA